MRADNNSCSDFVDAKELSLELGLYSRQERFGGSCCPAWAKPVQTNQTSFFKAARVAVTHLECPDTVDQGHPSHGHSCPEPQSSDPEKERLSQSMCQRSPG